jgi:drug/metabolite transporter (DMT)-like permease
MAAFEGVSNNAHNMTGNEVEVDTGTVLEGVGLPGEVEAAVGGKAVSEGSPSSPPPLLSPTTPQAAAPLWPYGALLVALLAMSSGGLWFSILPESPPLMKAFWRLFLTALLQSGGFYWEVYGGHGPRLSSEFWDRYRGSAPSLVVIGISLALHFGAWGWSVDHTSLAHSLLLVWTTPLLLVLLMFLRYWVGRQKGGFTGGVPLSDSEAPPAPLPPTLLESGGAGVGFLGVALLLSSVSSPTAEDRGVTIAGDAAALLGAAAIIPYLEGGAKLRAWMPLFVYALPVTLGASLWLALASLVLEGGLGATFWGTGPAAIFGFLGSPKRFGVAFGAASVSGILGHTLVNLAVKHLSPLLISVTCLSEPLLGSLLGYAIGVQGVPGAMTAIAAPLLILGGVMVNLGERKKA